MKIGSIAMEDDTVVEPTETPHPVDVELQSNELAQSAVTDTVQSLTEAEDIESTVGQLTDHISTDLENGQPLSEQSAALVEISMEHFRTRLGYKKPIVAAMENFKDGNKVGTEDTLKNLRQLHHSLGQGISVAQEGIVDRIVTGVKMSFATAEKVESRLDKAIGELSSKGAADSEFKAGAWGAYLTSKNGKISGKETIEHLLGIEKLLSDDAVMNDINELARLYKKVTGEVRDNWFYSNRRDIERIHDIAEKVSSVVSKYNSAKRTTGQDEQIAIPLTLEEAKKIKDIATRLINNDKFDKFIETYKSNANWGEVFMFINSNIRLKALASNLLMGKAPNAVKIVANRNLAVFQAHFGWLKYLTAEDIVEAEKVHSDIRGFFQSMSLGIGTKLKVTNAAAAYIEASAKK